MLFANINNKRVRAPIENKQSGIIALKAVCPACNSNVIAKCGKINIHHWSHIGNICRFDYEPETNWHREWKEKALKYGYEVEKVVNNNRIDAYNNNKCFEFQRNSIPVDDLINRTSNLLNYGEVNWIFEYNDKRRVLRCNSDECSIGMKSIRYLFNTFDKNRVKIYIDLGDHLFYLYDFIKHIKYQEDDELFMPHDIYLYQIVENNDVFKI